MHWTVCVLGAFISCDFHKEFRETDIDDFQGWHDSPAYIASLAY